MTTTSVDTSPSNTDSSNATNSELNTSASSSSPNQESDAHSVQQEVNKYKNTLFQILSLHFCL